MSNSSKIQTMSDDLDELKNSLQNSSQQVEEKKEKLSSKEKPAKKTISVDNVAEQAEATNVSDVAKQVNPERSIVESVISSMANGEISENKQDKDKDKSNAVAIKGKEKLGNKNISELQNLVDRISDTVPKKKPSLTVIKKEKVFDQKESQLPKPNIGLLNKETEEKISREIDKEMETRINREMEKKTKRETEKETKITMDIDSKVDKDFSISKKEKEVSKNEDVEKLKSLIDRISKTAEKGSVEKSVVEEKKKFGDAKADKAEIPIGLNSAKADKADKADKEEKSVVLNSRKDDVVKMSMAGEMQKRLPAIPLGINTKSVVKKPQEDISGHNKIDSFKEKSFWSNISEKLKKGNDSKKINEIKTVQDKDKKILENEIKKSSKTGILIKDSKESERTKKKEGKEKFDYLKGGKYMLPENRLIHGKQKFYSSVSKRIKLRKDKGEMEGLKTVSDIKKKQKILSREEEYKKLKKSIISKYHVKLFQMPWKKIAPIALVIILIITLSFYFITSFLVPKSPPPPPPNIVFGEGLSEFANIEKKITISGSSLKGLNKGNLEENAKDIFNENRNLKVIKLVIVNTEDKENRNILPLKNSLDALGIINIKDNKNYLPERFLEMSTDKYDFLIFKTKEGYIRYGIAIGLKDRYFMSEIMSKWEEERSTNKKMIVVFKPLFAGDRNYEDIYRSFNSVNYSGIEIKYVHLIDEDTALNYFIYNNNEDDGNDLLVITTSKNSTHAVVDLLTDNR